MTATGRLFYANSPLSLELECLWEMEFRTPREDLFPGAQWGVNAQTFIDGIHAGPLSMYL